ncbi:hypothetical protein [Rhodococcus daqingensis]|uniref:Secreted protein n=1 Tax=Rhodococcus daqingensis TaxID=2479363 RepID=A0ABW2RXG2_9NOCA
MSRTLARRGASVLFATALLGGGLALGGGTATAAEPPAGVTGSVEDLPGAAVGSVEELGFAALLFGGVSAGSIDEDDIFIGCAPERCPDPWPTKKEIFMAWLQGIDPDVAFPGELQVG